MTLCRLGGPLSRAAARTLSPLAFAICGVVTLGCTPPVTEDAVGPDAPLLPVEVTTTADRAMWGVLADCLAVAQPAGPTSQATRAPEAIVGVKAFPHEPGEEVDGCGRYRQSPPVGGDWGPQVAYCGFYPAPVPVPPAVTAMRRGAVWVVFRPDISEQEIKIIREATINSGFILASPQAGMEANLVLTAWGRQLPLESVTDPRFDEFIDTYTNSYRVPDIDGSCRSNLGEPQDRYR